MNSKPPDEPSPREGDDREITDIAEFPEIEEMLTNEPAINPTQADWRWWHFLLLLALFGPVLAPLFRAIGVAPFTSIAALIYQLGNLSSPLPNTAILLFGYPMAVCPLTYSVLIAITACALCYPVPEWFWARWQRVAWYLQLGVILLLVIPWLAFYTHSTPDNLPVWQLLMLLVGLVGGAGIALLAQVLAGFLASSDPAAEQR